VEYTRLGRSGLSVSRLCLGTMNFGAEADEQDSFAILDRALDAGINFFDTANTYGGRLGVGATEEIVGRWLARDRGRRDELVVATKVYGRMSATVGDGGLSARHIRKACEDSLRRLQTDRIDLYQMHHIDRAVPVDEVWEALELLLSQGKIIYCGSSNFAGWHIARAQEAAGKRNRLGLVSEQSLYNLVERSLEREVIPAAEYYGLSIIPWSPLHGGLLGGMLAEGGSRRAGGRSANTLPAVRPQLERYEAFCEKLGEPPAVVALAWLLSRPQVAAPIVGPRTLDQLEGALTAVDVKLDEAALAELDEIFPGHLTAPEDYAF
jgi:NDP-hexose C3-ketoreductase / dTDP-4-oxo-2-deoxy-alpha-D-pentos-2-ene 2,3-reductase